jgi:hypothetical protein
MGVVQRDRTVLARVVAPPPELATGASVHAFLGACRSATDNRPPSIMRLTNRRTAEWNAILCSVRQNRRALPRLRPTGSGPSHQTQWQMFRLSCRLISSHCSIGVTPAARSELCVACMATPQADGSVDESAIHFGCIGPGRQHLGFTPLVGMRQRRPVFAKGHGQGRLQRSQRRTFRSTAEYCRSSRQRLGPCVALHP